MCGQLHSLSVNQPVFSMNNQTLLLTVEEPIRWSRKGGEVEGRQQLAEFDARLMAKEGKGYIFKACECSIE